MKDLVNERSQVREKLISFNFQPVNAEDLASSPARSWDTLEQEIRSCNVFVLLLGERYGWIPTAGPHANQGLSITHLEYQEAKKLGMPILAFLKELSYDDSDRDSEDAKKRDKFRSEIRDYAGGYFTSSGFKLATDLANKVGEAVIAMLSDGFAKDQVAGRADAANQVARNLIQTTPIVHERSLITVPPNLVDAVVHRRAVLFAGAGFSLAAGLPSASAFSERFTQVIRESVPDYNINLIGSALAGVATDLEIVTNRQSLVAAVLGLLSLPQGVKPTSAHLHAVKLFDQIITTNFDTLFEEAAAAAGEKLPLVFKEIDSKLIPERVIIKLHGSAAAPESLSLNEREILLLDKRSPNLWDAVLNLLRSKVVVVVGTSLRDPSIIRLFSEGGDSLSGFFVAPYIEPTTAARVRRWNLECISSGANGLFDQLSNPNRLNTSAASENADQAATTCSHEH